MTDQQFEDLTIVMGTIASQAVFLAAGLYLVVTEHYGWAWIPLLAACCAGFRRTPKAGEESGDPVIGEKHG